MENGKIARSGRPGKWDGGQIVRAFILKKNREIWQFDTSLLFIPPHWLSLYTRLSQLLRSRLIQDLIFSFLIKDNFYLLLQLKSFFILKFHTPYYSSLRMMVRIDRSKNLIYSLILSFLGYTLESFLLVEKEISRLTSSIESFTRMKPETHL